MDALRSWTFVSSVLLLILTFPVWHIRWLGSLVYYFFLRRFAWSQEPDRLLAPLVMTRRCSLFEYDINGHKSNSTYFLDADISVGELIPRLASGSFHLRRKAKKFAFPRLGAVGGIFLKEIRLFQTFKISTRIVAWDSKWIYVVTKFTSGNVKKETIFAIILSKVVFKQGRETISPDVVFEESDLLPTTSNSGTSLAASNKPRAGNGVAKAARLSDSNGGLWSREHFEDRRKRGLAFVQGLLDVESLRSLESETCASEHESMHSLW